MTKERADKIKAAVRVLVDEVNGGNPAEMAEVIFNEITRTHRTLQQSFWGAIKITIHKYGSLEEHWTDLRNSMSWKWAKEVSQIPNSDVRFPLI